MSRHLLLVGASGSGKTSVLQKTLNRLTKVRFGGFFSFAPERGLKDRQIVVVRGRGRELAERLLTRESRVARVAIFDPSSLVEQAVPALLDALGTSEILVIDGIGEFEARQPGFADAVRKAFAGKAPVLATALGLDEPLVREIADRPDVEVLRVTTANRCTLDAAVADRLMTMLRSTSCGAGSPSGPGSGAGGDGLDPTSLR